MSLSGSDDVHLDSPGGSKGMAMWQKKLVFEGLIPSNQSMRPLVLAVV
jgi:hypothetical protein